MSVRFKMNDRIINRIKKLSMETDLSQREIADALNISQCSVSKTLKKDEGE